MIIWGGWWGGGVEKLWCKLLCQCWIRLTIDKIFVNYKWLDLVLMDMQELQECFFDKWIFYLVWQHSYFGFWNASHSTESPCNSFALYTLQNNAKQCKTMQNSALHFTLCTLHRTVPFSSLTANVSQIYFSNVYLNLIYEMYFLIVLLNCIFAIPCTVPFSRLTAYNANNFWLNKF